MGDPSSITCTEVAMPMDLFPTICQAADIHGSETIDGRSVLATLLGKSQPAEERCLFWVRLEGGKRYQGEPYYCVRQGPWKLLQNDANQPLQLVNLDDDSEEKTDLTDRHPQIAAQLHRALEEHKARYANVPYRDKEGRGPNEVRE